MLCFSFPSQGSLISFEKDPASMHALFGGATRYLLQHSEVPLLVVEA